METRVCIILLTVACVTYAGEQFQNFFEVEDEFSLLREKRSSDTDEEFLKEMKKQEKFCCNFTARFREATEDEMSFMEEMSRSCTDKAQDDSNKSNENSCFWDCILQTFNMTDDKGNILEDEEHVNNFRKLCLYEDEATMQKSISTCPTWCKETARKFKGSKCNSQSMFFMLCDGDMKNLYCPEDLQIKSEQFQKFDKEKKFSLLREKRNSDTNEEFNKEISKHDKFCCNYTARFRETTEEELAVLKGTIRTCSSKTQDIADKREENTCFWDCVLQTWNMTDEKGNILEDEEHVNLFRKLCLYQDEVTKQKTISICPTWSKETARKYEGSKCNSQSLFFILCDADMKNLYCPEDLKLKSEECEEHRNNLKNMFPSLEN